jgi:hypothetical protein
VFWVPLKEMVYNALVTLGRLNSTPLFQMTKIYHWGTAWVEILLLTILAECAKFPHKPMLGSLILRPKAVARFI